MISIIAAHANNNVIGLNNDLPWYIPEDLKHFKAVTLNHPVIMGRKTYESIVARLGKPLPGRRNIIISTTLAHTDGVEVVSNLQEAIELTEQQDAFIIGGAQVYQTALSSNIVDKMYITRVNNTYKGDAFFPDYNVSQWEEVERIDNTQNDLSYSFITYHKKAQE